MKTSVLFRLALPFFIVPLFSQAQEDARKIKLDARRPLRVDYVAPSWNKDPKTAESSALLIRDALSGRIVRVEVTESEPNSGYFVGIYQINFQASDKPEFTPELYVAPLALVKTDQQMARIESLIKEGTLLRKPYFLRTERGMQTLSVFDSRSQAVEAYQAFLKTGSGRPIVDPAAFDAQRHAQKSAEEKSRLETEKAAESERERLEAAEKARQEELKKKQSAMDAAAKAKARAQSEALGKEALEAYKKDDFATAEKKFTQATDLDPENNRFAFQYGVTLYRLEKYNQAIVTLKLAQGEGVNPNERDYYIGLSHLKLKEYEQSLKVFGDLKSRNDKVLSPSAAFFSGVIEFQKENYDVAKSNFEYVLDNSSDSKMDQQAESYIEQIANVKRFEEMRKKKIILSANLGVMYDSNILSAADSTKPTGMEGFRWVYGGSAEYRPIFTQVHEFSAILSITDMYSTDSGFAAKKQFQDTDPLVMNFSLPYKWKGLALGKPAQLGLTPAYEQIQMNADGEGSRETIVNSQILKGDGTFVMNEDYFANYALELRNDKSLLSTSGTADDQTATKATLSTTQTMFQDKKKSRAIIAEASLANNAALGDNQKYNRVDVAGSYMMPGAWETTMVSRLGLGYADYASHAQGRKDTAITLNIVFQKQLTEKMGALLTAGYNKNSSTLDANTYNKYTIMTGLSWKDAF